MSLKTRIEDNKVISRGIAVVQYAAKEAAAKALKGMPFETTLGPLIEIDFYQSKESRMVTAEKENNPIQQVLNPAIINAFKSLRPIRSRSPTKGGGRGRKQRNINTNNKPGSKNRSRSKTNGNKSVSPTKHNQ